MGCARCHDHKYDPITQKDYYRLFAFFNNVTEQGVGDYGQPIRRNTPPFQKLATPEADAKLVELKRQLAAANEHLTNLMTTLRATDGAEWENCAKSAVLTWSNAEPLNAFAGTNALAMGQPGGWVSAPSLKPEARKVKMTARVNASRATAIELEFAAPLGLGTNDSQTLSIRTVRLTRAESPELEKSALPLRATTLTGTAPGAELAKVLDQKSSGTWSVTLTDERTTTGVFELPDSARSTLIIGC